jgi:hypothetical protein
MGAKLLILMLAAIPAMLSYDSSVTLAQPPGILAAAESEISGRDSLLSENQTQMGFDLEYCQRECRSRFGLEPQTEIEEHFRGGRGRGLYYEYANCIAACNATFWREFDNKIRDLEKLR